MEIRAKNILTRKTVNLKRGISVPIIDGLENVITNLTNCEFEVEYDAISHPLPINIVFTFTSQNGQKAVYGKSNILSRSPFSLDINEMDIAKTFSLVECNCNNADVSIGLNIKEVAI